MSQDTSAPEVVHRPRRGAELFLLVLALVVGLGAYAAVGLGMEGEILVCVFVATKSHSQYEDALRKLAQDLTIYGHDLPEVFYTDNMIDKPMLEKLFVSLREGRDRALPMPKLILSALQVNIRGGCLPEPESNGRRFLKIPLDAIQGAPWGDD